MSKIVVVSGLALLAAAAFVPIGATAEALGGGDAERLEALQSGVLLLKAALGVLAIVLFAVERFSPRTGAFEPLVASGIEAPPSSSRSSLAGLGLLLVLALALRLPALGEGLSFDEIDTLVHYARLPLERVVTTFDSQNQHLLYSVLARISFVIFGESAWAVRLPAVLLGVASVLAVHRFARLVASEREALFAAALLAVSHHHVWFSQNARGYTGLLCFTLLGSSAFLRLLREREPRGIGPLVEYGVWMALATLTHATAVFAVAAHGLVWIGASLASRTRAVGPNRFRPAIAIVLAATISLTLHALVLPQFVATLLEPTMPGAQTEWKDPLWLVRETLGGLSRGIPGGYATLAVGTAVALLGVVSYARQSLAVAGTFLLGTAITIAALLATKHNLWPRMFFFSAGFFVLIALRGVSEAVRLAGRPLGPARISTATGVAFALICAASLSTVRAAWLPKQDFEGARAFVETSRAPGDAVATVDMTVMPYADFFTTSWTPVDNVGALRSLETTAPRTWIVYSTPTRMRAAQPEIWERIQSEYRVAGTYWGTLGGSEIVVAVRER